MLCVDILIQQLVYLSSVLKRLHTLSHHPHVFLGAEVHQVDVGQLTGQDQGQGGTGLLQGEVGVHYLVYETEGLKAGTGYYMYYWDIQ